MRKLLRPDAGRSRTPLPRVPPLHIDGQSAGERHGSAGTPLEIPAATAAYVAQMAVELSALAKAARLEMLAYLLDMAQAEAELQARAVATAAAEPDAAA